MVLSKSGCIVPQGDFYLSVTGLGNDFAKKQYETLNGNFKLNLPKGKFMFKAKSSEHGKIDKMVDNRNTCPGSTFFIQFQ